MQKTTFKKLSILGLVLMAASAVTAAIIPTSKPAAFDAFSLSAQTNDGNASTESCMPTAAAEDDACQDDSVTNVDDSGTTSIGDASDGATTAA